MLKTIQFDRKARRGTIQIQKEPSGGMLAAKLESGEASGSQGSPKLPLFIRLFAAELPGAFGWIHPKNIASGPSSASANSRWTLLLSPALPSTKWRGGSRLLPSCAQERQRLSNREFLLPPLHTLVEGRAGERRLPHGPLNRLGNERKAPPLPGPPLHFVEGRESSSAILRTRAPTSVES